MKQATHSISEKEPAPGHRLGKIDSPACHTNYAMVPLGRALGNSRLRPATSRAAAPADNFAVFHGWLASPSELGFSRATGKGLQGCSGLVEFGGSEKKPCERTPHLTSRLFRLARPTN